MKIEPVDLPTEKEAELSRLAVESDLDLFGGNFALRDEQPHLPTLQEFRTSKAWIHLVGQQVQQQWKAMEEEKPQRKGPKKTAKGGPKTKKAQRK